MTGPSPGRSGPGRSGKGQTDENFPVAGLIAPDKRPCVLAFYRFARLADDIADAGDLAPDAKLSQLDALRAALAGEPLSAAAHPDAAVAAALRAELLPRGVPVQHGLDLLEAFRLDVLQPRTADWPALMAYCRLSAAPVGRFLLDLHGEDRALWPANDALCAALQVINHLQDCAKDQRQLDRVYLPQDHLARAGVDETALAAPAASPALRTVLTELADRTDALLAQARPLAAGVRDIRLALEIAVIQRLAEDLVRRLRARDPLSQRVHHTKPEAALLALGALLAVLPGRLLRRRRRPEPAWRTS